MKRLSSTVGAMALLAGLACSDGPTTPAAEPTSLTLTELTISNAVTPSAVGLSSSASVGGAGAEANAYVSLPPGVLPQMVSVRIRNVTAGDVSPAVPMVDGGFDPVPVVGSTGDELELTFTDGSGATSVAYVVIPSESPPTVVRTNPPRGRTDVALSTRVTVVFSEPIDPGTLAEGVRLLKGGAEVAAAVHLLPDEPWIAELVPAALLEPGTTYELLVTTAVRDLDGEALGAPITATFTTGQAAVAPASATLQIVSGNDQPGRAGTELPEPFVVQVRDPTGAGVPGVEVAWTVTTGEGVLNGLWWHCADMTGAPTGVVWAPAPTTSAHTDAEGMARISFMPTWFGPVDVRASVPGGAVIFTTDASDPGATLEVVPGYGDMRERWAWASGYVQPPLVVTVKDGQGNPVPHIDVKWRVESGEGLVSGCVPWSPPWAWPGMNVRTRSEASYYGQGEPIPSITSLTPFTPRALGRSTVSASVAGVRGSPVRFELDATVALIHQYGPRFYGPEPSAASPSDVVVPVGTKVEFKIGPPTAHIVSTSVPPGAVSFDSGVLNQNGRIYDPENDPLFGFVPNVVGTWTFVDQITGATGTVTAY
jgi:hypothetical protein